MTQQFRSRAGESRRKSGDSYNAAKHFHRVVRWDLGDGERLLLGTNSLVWRDRQRGADSREHILDLRESAQRYSEAAALGYWLKAKASAAPELAVCVHAAGEIQAYDVVSTEDLPWLSCDSPANAHREGLRPAFNPAEIEANGSKLVRWLQQRCVDESSTYYLTRGKHTGGAFELRRLSDDALRRAGTAISTRVSALCYRLARQMLQRDGPRSEIQLARLRALLQRSASLSDRRRAAMLHVDA